MFQCIPCQSGKKEKARVFQRIFLFLKPEMIQLLFTEGAAWDRGGSGVAKFEWATGIQREQGDLVNFIVCVE